MFSNILLSILKYTTRNFEISQPQLSDIQSEILKHYLYLLQYHQPIKT